MKNLDVNLKIKTIFYNLPLSQNFIDFTKFFSGLNDILNDTGLNDIENYINQLSDCPEGILATLKSELEIHAEKRKKTVNINGLWFCD